jgi:hypothetical protein
MGLDLTASQQAATGASAPLITAVAISLTGGGRGRICHTATFSACAGHGTCATRLYAQLSAHGNYAWRVSLRRHDPLPFRQKTTLVTRTAPFWHLLTL